MTATKPVVTFPSKPFGLTEAEVADRRARGETNAIDQTSGRSYKRILIQNTFSFINILLFAIVIMLLALGLWGDAGMTAIIVVANVVVAIVQELRAKRQLDKIAVLTRPTATVIREGREQTIDPNDIVQGDLLVARPGDQILVDGQIRSEGEITVDESLLTGESDLMPKKSGDQVSSGTFCMTGSAMYEATRVGAASMAHQITSQARAHRDPQTPLQREIGLVLQIMLVLVVALTVQVILSLRGTAHGFSFSQSVQAAAVLVSLVPQGLALMVTVTYAMAAVRMAGKGALIQRMNAVESASNIDILCLDKTGTLTSNALTLETVLPVATDEGGLRFALGLYAASTNSRNRTIEAIGEACRATPGQVVDEIPFSSARKWSALAFNEDGSHGVYVFGAPEMLQPAVRPLPVAAVSENGAAPVPNVEMWASQGLRVLMLAYCPGRPRLRGDNQEPVLPGNLTPLGYAILRDELRPEAKETIAQFRDAGIDLKIISGDNPETVSALARQAGFPTNIRAVSGLALEGLDDQGLEMVANDTTVFGRITPEMKQRLVSVLRNKRHYVAMIGDGVNDVLALKQANLAVAMHSGNQVTRGAADIILLNDSFGALPSAFREGQRIRRGMQDIIRLFLVRTLYVALIIFGTSALGAEFPFTPKNNGILALLTVGIPAFALAAWARPGITPRRLVLSGSHFVIPAAVTIAGVGLIAYLFYLKGTGNVILARSALTAVTIFCGLILIPFAQPPNEGFTGGTELNGDWRPTWLALGMLGLYFVVLGIPFLRDFYAITYLSVPGYLIMALVAIGWAASLRYLWRLNILQKITLIRGWVSRRV